MPNKSIAGFETHVNPIRLYVRGEGNLQLTLFTLDDIRSESLRDIAMSVTAENLTDTLSNFRSQYIAIEGQVTEISEYFVIGTITPFVKPVAASLPVL